MSPREEDITSNYLEAFSTLALGSGGKVKRFPGITCFRSPIDLLEFNRAFVLNSGGIEYETLRQVQEFYRELKVGWCLTAVPDVAHLLDGAMKYVRISEWRRSPEMIIRREQASFRKIPPFLKVRVVAGVDELRDWTKVAAAGLEIRDADIFAPMANARCLRMPGLTFFLGCIGGRAVATSASCVSRRVAGVFIVTTVPDSRGRGCGEAMAAVAAEEGFSKGCDISSLQSSPTGYPIYYRMGYRHVFDFHHWVVRQNAADVSRGVN